MGTSPELLKNSPLNNFLLPGLFLLLINGLATLAGSILSFLRHRRAGEAGIVLGALLFLWIVIQVWWIGLSSALQPVFLVVGVAETALGWKIRSELRKNQGV